MIEVLRYVTESGREVIREWLDDLHDARAVTRIVMRLDRLADGNFGDCKPLRDGVCEVRIDYGLVTGFTMRWSAEVACCCFAAVISGSKRATSAGRLDI